MSDITDSGTDSIDYAPTQGQLAMRPKLGTRSKFMPIVQSPYKNDIDRLLFTERARISSVLSFLEEEAAAVGMTNNISQAMLYRYRKDCEAQVYPIEILQATGEQVTAQWKYLNLIIEQGLKLQPGLAAQPKDVLQAIKIQQEMMREMGVNEAVKVIEQSREVFGRIITTISEILDEYQMKQLYDKLRQDELIANWIVDEAENGI